MKALRTRIIMLVALGCFLLSSPVLAITAEKYSGFIENYPALKVDKDRKGALVYYKPGIVLKAYNKVVIAPIEIFYAPDAKYKGIKPDQLKALADAFRATIVNELEPKYPVITKPGADVMLLRIAITNVYAQKKKRRLRNYTPIGLVVGGIKKLAGKNISIADATIEIEILNSQTNERLGVLIDRQSASPEKKKGALTSWDEISETLTFYAKRFRAGMDTEHGR